MMALNDLVVKERLNIVEIKDSRFVQRSKMCFSCSFERCIFLSNNNGSKRFRTVFEVNNIVY